MTEESKPTDGSFIQINNGKNIKSWFGVLVIILGVYGSGLLAWRSLATDVIANQKKDKEICAEFYKEMARIDAEIHRVDIKHTEKMAQFVVLGSDVSRRTANTVNRQEETLKWLKDNMIVMQGKLDRVLLRDDR